MNYRKYLLMMVTVLLLTYLLISYQIMPSIGHYNSSQKKMFKKLDFVFLSNSRSVSTNPLESDSIVNLAHMEHLIGTLVKTGLSSRLEPYLATEWSVEDDFKTWNFKIREGITCTDGSLINAKKYKNSLIKVMGLILKKKKFIPVFSDLLDFESLLDGDIKGIEYTETTLTFKFKKPTRSGVLEFLSMPYFGFYCASNFDKNGQWKSGEEIISSGPYKLKSLSSSDRKVILTARENWFSVSQNSPNEVNISQDKVDNLKNYKNKNTTILSINERINFPWVSYTELFANPEILIAMVVSPEIKNLFHNIKNRKYFRNMVSGLKKEIAFDEVKFKEDWFYPAFPSDVEKEEVSYADYSNNKVVKVLLSDHLTKNQVIYVKKLIELALKPIKKGK